MFSLNYIIFNITLIYGILFTSNVSSNCNNSKYIVGSNKFFNNHCIKKVRIEQYEYYNNESKSYQFHHTVDANYTEINLYKFLNAIPSLEESLPINSANIQCAKDSQYVLQKANHLQLWALQMLDSSGKLSSGLLKGNINQLGDFDECLNAIGIHENEKKEIRGKYCLAAIDVRLPSTLRNIDRLTHSHYIIKSKLTDPGHRVPKFASMYWASCVPDSCTNEDVKALVVSRIQKLEIPGIQKDVAVEDFMCHANNNKKFNIAYGTMIALSFFIGIILLTAVSTIFDLNNFFERKSENGKIDGRLVLESFSLKKNLNILLNTNESPGDVACLHGIRTWNAIALLLSHKCMQLLFYPYVNRTQMTELISYPWSMLGRSAIVYTDSFVLLSGCLAAQSFLKSFDRKQSNIVNSYLSRFLRLTPNFAAIILFCTFVLPYIGSGPLWNVVVTRHSELCRSNWWKNMLYIHNYHGFEEMCLTHTHQLGIDMQLYIASPILIYLLWKLPKLAVVISTLLAIISTYLRYQVTLQNSLSPIIYFGVSVTQLFKTASMSYILPTHRATVYIMGILLGYHLHYKSPIKLSKQQVQYGTFFFTVCGFLGMFGTYWMSDRNYIYSPKEAALYMAFSPIIWCSSLIWGILITVHGYSGFFGAMFSWKGYRVFTRIAYAVYLIQFPVYFYNVGSNRSPRYFTSQVLFNIEEYAVIFILSTVLTLLFDLPFQNISRHIKLKSPTINHQKNWQNEIKSK